MARVVYTQIPVGTTSSSGVNTIFTDISTQSTAVDEQNVAEEGLDFGVLETSIQSVRAFTPITDTSGTQALTTSWATLDFGTTVKSGAITVESDEILLVRLQFGVESVGSTYGVPDGGQIEVKLQYKPNGGSDTDFASSLRKRQPPTDVDGAGNGGGDGCFPSMMKLDGALTLDYVQAVIRDASGNDVTITLNSLTFSGRIYKRH